MKYIVWNLISSYDGYFEEYCDDWEAAIAKLKEIASHTVLKYKVDKFLSGGISKLEHYHKGELINQLFITTAPINNSVKHDI